jgi:hypothetical protein
MVAALPGAARVEVERAGGERRQRAQADHAAGAAPACGGLARGARVASPAGMRHPLVARVAAVALAAVLDAATTAAAPRAMPQSPDPATAPHVAIPAFTAYAHPDPARMRRNDDGSVARAHGELQWYVDVATPGELRLALARLPDAPTAMLQWHIASVDAPPGTPTNWTPIAASAGQRDVALGAATVASGPHRIALRAAGDAPLHALARLDLRGPAAAGLHTNVAERRNAASIHLGYVVPQPLRDDVAWFHVAVTPRTDPLWSYYMATGWHRGYFGMQVNSPTERRVIFSVWDSGDEAVDRAKVAAADRVQLVAKGEGVHAGDFGNEGTGGHSHWQHPWRLGETFRFLLHARVDGNATIYTGWFWLAEAKAWRLIASFRAPKDGKLPRGLYSFSENFAGENGDARREAEFGDVFVRAADGPWTALGEARFTHDPTGETIRRDRWGLVRGDRFVLGHGGFATPPAGAVRRYDERLRAPATAWTPPADVLLPTPPTIAK